MANDPAGAVDDHPAGAGTNRAAFRAGTRPRFAPRPLVALGGSRAVRRLLLAAGLVVAGLAAPSAPAAASTASTALVPLRVTTFAGSLTHPWDLDFAADGTMFFTQRGGRMFVRLRTGTVRQIFGGMADAWVSGETGLMAIELDPGFASNRRLYTCQGTTDNDFTVQVVAWRIDAAYTRLVRVADPLVGGIDASSGRHGGCQLLFDSNGRLLIGTGDAATGTNPQNRRSLAGKVLRVDRMTGAGVPGNPFFTGGGDPRILTIGHRNVQGLAMRANGQLYSVEHGTNRDDEINRLVQGANYGWDPVPGYDESRPMTDLAKFPNARRAIWSSGNPTIATSGAAFLTGSAWGSWQGALAVATLKGRHLRLFFLDSVGRVRAVAVPPELNGRFGRLRGATTGPDGALYLTTDNGNGVDRILRVAPG